MSIYNTLTLDPKQSHPVKGESHKVQHIANGTCVSPGLGYPDLYVEIAFKSDSKTKLVNPGNAYTKDFILMVAPYRGTLSEAFHMPTLSLLKTIKGSRLEYSFRYSVQLGGSAKITAGFKDFFGVEKTMGIGTGMVSVEGWFDTVTYEGEVTAKKIDNPNGKMKLVQ